MSGANCTHSMPADRRPLVVLWALTWFCLQWGGHRLLRTAAAGSVWLDRSRQRRQLAELSDHMLRDLGLTRADVWAETGKPFWRP